MFKVIFVWVILRGIVDWLTGRRVSRLEPGSVTAGMIRGGAITSVKIASGYVGISQSVTRSDTHAITTTLSGPIRRQA